MGKLWGRKLADVVRSAGIPEEGSGFTIPVPQVKERSPHAVGLINIHGHIARVSMWRNRKGTFLLWGFRWRYLTEEEREQILGEVIMDDLPDPDDFDPL